MSHNHCAIILKKVKIGVLALSFEEDIKNRLVASKKVTPPSYGVPKIHKRGIPLRPIFDTIGSSTYPLAMHLEKLIACLVGKSYPYVKNLTHFFQFIKDVHLESNNFLVSFDMVSLFKKLPNLDSIEIVKCKTNGEIASLVDLCLKSTFFSFQGVIYEKFYGVSMGSPLSPIIINL